MVCKKYGMKEMYVSRSKGKRIGIRGKALKRKDGKWLQRKGRERRKVENEEEEMEERIVQNGVKVDAEGKFVWRERLEMKVFVRRKRMKGKIGREEER